MPEEACEVQSEDNRALPDKNKKRRFKTPDQVEALEKFYSEHKYPSEELKSQFAVSLGLTEKQISGWFCHRRLKDKRLLSGEASANGKQDRSSGIIVPDHGSGHKQDSCGSTKEGGTRHFDHREVQSRGFSVQDPLVADLAYEHGRHHDGKDSDLDDTSSGSSLPLQKRLHSQNGDPANVAAFSYVPETENIARATNLMGVRTRPGPSGYLKLKGRAENPAITSVKRQLGRHYQEDGPPLSVEFDPLPPGAFEFSMNNPDNEPPDLSVPDVQHSPDVVTNCDVYNAEMSPRNPHLDGSTFQIKPSSLGHSTYIGHQSMWKPAFSNRCTPFSKQKSSTELDEGFSHETTVYDRRPYKMMAQHDHHGRRKDGFSDSGQRNSWPHKSEDVTPEQLQGQHFDSKYPNLLVRRSESFDMETKRISKDDKFVRERTAINKSSNSATVQGGKRVWEEFLEQRCKRKARKADPPLWTNQTKRSAAADRPSSFSEDETAETSSSGD